MRVSDDAQKGALAAILLTLGDTKESPGALLAEGEKRVEFQQKIITEIQRFTNRTHKVCTLHEKEYTKNT